MYLADYHTHSQWSPDAHYSMTEMARAAVKAGLQEICFTDHVEIMNSGSWQRNRFDWAALERDLSYASTNDPELSRRQIADYLELVLQQAKWGRFSVLGHLTLPLRYMKEKCGLDMTFDGFEAEVEEIFRTLIGNGCGIELNTNRGHDPLPGEKWLKLYRACGGEIITLGSDAHSPEYVGFCIRERQELLRACGFTRFCTFRDQKPVFHELA